MTSKIEELERVIADGCESERPFIEVARAAIRALMNPSEAQRTLAERAIKDVTDPTAYNALLQAVLEEGSQET
jgi:hypothetical protein